MRKFKEKKHKNDLVFIDDFQCQNDLVFVDDFQCRNDSVFVERIACSLGNFTKGNSC